MTESDRQGPDKDRADSRPPLENNDGVDVSLIRWMLSLTHKERLEVLQNNVNSIIRPRNAKHGS